MNLVVHNCQFSQISNSRCRRLQFRNNRKRYNLKLKKTVYSAENNGFKESRKIRQIGDVLKQRYEVVEVLGSGGNATTYKCIDKNSTDEPQNKSYIAVKELNLGNIQSWKQYELFEREAKILQQLDHPAIPKYLDYFEEDQKSFFIAYTLAPGISLAQKVSKQNWRASQDEIYRIAIQLLEVLNYLGSLSPPVVHRDIKPENVIAQIESDGQVKMYLVDFGAIASSSPFESNNSTIVGTYGYMAPEQFRGMASPSSDLYAVGGTLLYHLTAKHPWQFQQTERMRVKFISEVPPAFQNDKLCQVIEGLLEPISEDRMTTQQAINILTSDTQPVEFQRSFRRKPVGARSIVDRGSGGRLVIDIPARGLGVNSIAPATFAVAWNAIVATWTISAVASAGIVPLLFSIPFWVAGVQVSKSALGGAFIRESLEIDREQFRIKRSFALFKDGKPDFQDGKIVAEGDVADLVEAQIIQTMIVNDEPIQAIQLIEGVRKHTFGASLENLEQQWLRDEINDAIKRCKRKYLVNNVVETSSS